MASGVTRRGMGTGLTCSLLPACGEKVAAKPPDEGLRRTRSREPCRHANPQPRHSLHPALPCTDTFSPFHGEKGMVGAVPTLNLQRVFQLAQAIDLFLRVLLLILGRVGEIFLGILDLSGDAIS